MKRVLVSVKVYNETHRWAEYRGGINFSGTSHERTEVNIFAMKNRGVTIS